MNIDSLNMVFLCKEIRGLDVRIDTIFCGLTNRIAELERTQQMLEQRLLDVQLWKDAQLQKVPGTVEHKHAEEVIEFSGTFVEPNWYLSVLSCLDYLSNEPCICQKLRTEWGESALPCFSCAATQLLKEKKEI